MGVPPLRSCNSMFVVTQIPISLTCWMSDVAVLNWDLLQPLRVVEMALVRGSGLRRRRPNIVGKLATIVATKASGQNSRLINAVPYHVSLWVLRVALIMDIILLTPAKSEHQSKASRATAMTIVSAPMDKIDMTLNFLISVSRCELGI